jgi:hypothetical protein
MISAWLAAKCCMESDPLSHVTITLILSGKTLNIKLVLFVYFGSHKATFDSVPVSKSVNKLIPSKTSIIVESSTTLALNV